MTRLTCLLEPTSEARRRGYPTGREEQCAAARHLRPPAAAAAAAAAVEEDDDEVTGQVPDGLSRTLGSGPTERLVGGFRT